MTHMLRGFPTFVTPIHAVRRSDMKPLNKIIYHVKVILFLTDKVDPFYGSMTFRNWSKLALTQRLRRQT